MKNIEEPSVEIKNFVLPKNIKIEIKKNVTELKELLKDDQEFANEIISSLHNIAIGEEYYDTFYFRVKNRYDYKEFPNKSKLICTVNDLAYLVAGEHEYIPIQLKEQDFDHELTNSIEQYIIQIFYTEESTTMHLLGEHNI